MTRPYHQTARAQGSVETRRHIVEAARACVLHLGYNTMRIEDVAAKAGVSRASVFRHFRNKAALLRAVEADAAERAGVATLIQEISSLPPREALLSAIRTGSRVWAREARVFREFYGEAPFNSTLRPLAVAKEGQRHAVVAGLVRRLKEDGWLASEASTDWGAVTDALWLLTGFGAYDALTRVRDLSTEGASDLIERIVLDAFINDQTRKAT
jgi:AcrR family transcriptional regulator